MFLPKTPAELAIPFAQDMFDQNLLDEFKPATQNEQHSLIELERIAELYNMLGRQYLVHSYRSAAIPVSFEDDEIPSGHNFSEGLDFSGELVTFSTVRIGKSLGSTSLRALCLTFNNVTLLPYFDSLPDDQLLYTPAFAVKDMERIA